MPIWRCDTRSGGFCKDIYDNILTTVIPKPQRTNLTSDHLA